MLRVYMDRYPLFFIPRLVVPFGASLFFPRLLHLAASCLLEKLFGHHASVLFLVPLMTLTALSAGQAGFQAMFDHHILA